MSLLRNTAFTSVGQLVSLTLTMLSGIILARWLGPEQRGTYALIATTVAILGVLASFGLQPALSFLVGKRLYPQEMVAGHCIWLAVLLVCGFAGVLLILPGRWTGIVLRGLPPSSLWLMIGLLGPMLLSGFMSAVLSGMDRIRLMVVISLTNVGAAFVLLLILVVWLDLGLTGALSQLVGSALISVALSLWILIRRVGVKLHLHPRLIRDAFTFGVKIYPGSISYSLLNRIDVYFVNFFSGQAAVGLYSVAVSTAEKLWVVDQAVSQAIIPKVLATTEGDAARVTSMAFRVTLWAMIGAVTFAAILSPWLIPVLYGDKFAGSVPAFLLLLPGVVCLAARVISPFFSMQMGKPQIPTYYTAAMAVVSIPVYYFATKEFGYLGAAAASSVIYVGLALVTVGLFLRFSREPARRLLLPGSAEIKVLRRILAR